MTLAAHFRCLLLPLFVCAISILQPAASAFAQATPAQAQGSHSTPKSRKPPTMDDRVTRLAKALDLTDAQQVQMKSILERRHSETLRLRNDPHLTGSQRIDEFRVIQDETVQQIRAILTEEQKRKYDPLTARKLEQQNQEQAKDWLKLSSK
ncbi:MAG TPA: hypothetical protein VMJ35_14130 [Dongiaceae bacterium]|nr:hypothetical protein [Dongiaceae bacterium]